MRPREPRSSVCSRRSISASTQRQRAATYQKWHVGDEAFEACSRLESGDPPLLVHRPVHDLSVESNKRSLDPRPLNTVLGVEGGSCGSREVELDPISYQTFGDELAALSGRIEDRSGVYGRPMVCKEVSRRGNGRVAAGRVLHRCETKSSSIVGREKLRTRREPSQVVVRTHRGVFVSGSEERRHRTINRSASPSAPDGSLRRGTHFASLCRSPSSKSC